MVRCGAIAAIAGVCSTALLLLPFASDPPAPTSVVVAATTGRGAKAAPLGSPAEGARTGDGVAVTYCGYLGVAVPERGHLARRMLVDVLGADVFVAGSYNDGDCASTSGYRDAGGGCLWQRVQGLEPITGRSLVRKRSRAELEAAVSSAPHFGAVKTSVEAAQRQGHLFFAYNTWTPVLASPRGHFLHQMSDYSRALDLVAAHEARRRRPYARLIFSRLELAWLSPHPPLRLLDPSLLWIPTGKPRMNDRHVVLARRHAEVWYRRWELYRSPDLLDVLPLASLVHDGAEAVVENLLVARGIDVGEFPAAAYLVCCDAEQGCWQKNLCEWRPLFCGRRAASALNSSARALLSRGRGAHHGECVGVQGKYRAEVSLATLHAQMLACGAGYEPRGPSDKPMHSPTAPLPPPIPAEARPRRRLTLDGGDGRWRCEANAADTRGDACVWSEGGVNTSSPNLYWGSLALVPRGGDARGAPPAGFGDWRCAWDGGEGEGAGYCANTETGAGGDCARDDKGSWAMGPPALRTEADCARRCAACERCRYVSVSLSGSDCSWYRACDTRQLSFLSFTGHRTLPVSRGGPGGAQRSGGTHVHAPAAQPGVEPPTECVPGRLCETPQHHAASGIS